MISKDEKLRAAIWLYHHYKQQAGKCFDIYGDIYEAYFMFDFYMGIAESYERMILSEI